jgi:predicted NBD/HSP70 family sugar kinase
VHPDLERIIGEDEVARAAVDAAAARVAASLDAVKQALASERERRLGELRARVNATVAAIVADSDAEVARRRAARESFERERAAAAAAAIDAAVDLFVTIVRDGPPARGRP